MSNFNNKLEGILKKDIRFLDQDGDLLKSEVVNKAWKVDKDLIELILEDKEVKAKFFSEIKGHWIFNVTFFVEFVQDKNFLNDSYTKFKNKIGLTIDNKYLNQRGEVAMVWPYKDCLLEGGMNDEDSKRDEIFFNEILAQDEIDRLLDPKVLTNLKRYTEKGTEKLKEFKRDKNGDIKDNLIVKGNNLMAMHSLKKEFAGKVKLIYIDPPYNTGNDGFRYNDQFNHSTWLTFMKNRLEVARELLREDGVMFVQCDHHEVGYLNVLMDEIFKRENKVQVIAIRTASAAGFKTVNPGPIDVTEYILYYSKAKNQVNFKKAYTAVGYNKNYNQYIKNIKDAPEKWKIVPLTEQFYKEMGIKSNNDAKDKWGDNWKKIRDTLIGEFALKNADKVVSKRDPHKPTEKVKELMEKSKSTESVIEYKRDGIGSLYLYLGGSLAFYSKKLREIDGELTPTELLSDFWSDISWAGIANEGGVKLKNGKKPERLIQRIIEMTTEPGDIVLDYHLGSGTTCSVAHKMRRQYIGIEQMDYIEDLAVKRVQNAINGDTTGVSKSESWQGGGEFVYLELKTYNQDFVDRIQAAKKTKDLEIIWEDMKKKSFLNWNVDFRNADLAFDEWKELDFEKQQHALIQLLNKNQLYVNLSEADDESMKCSEEEKRLSTEFYGK